MYRQAMVSETVVTLADNLVADFDVVGLLTTLTERCVSVLGVAAASAMLVGPSGALRVVGSSSEQIRLLGAVELQTEQGPGLECYQTGAPVIHDDLSTAIARWPQFAPEALAAGFHSVHAVPMHRGGNVIGALNLFQANSDGTDAIDGNGVVAAHVFADIATISILQNRASIESTELIDQLNTALTTRIVIEQAKGIVSESQNLDMEHAFAALRSHARNHNMRLADVAAAMVDGTLRPSALTSPAHSAQYRANHSLRRS